MFLGLLVLLLNSVSSGPDSTSPGYTVLPANPGEVCTVCGTPLGEDDVALMIRGRRVPLARGMLPQFLSDRERYFAELQPRGALFQEAGSADDAADPGPVDFFWFAVGLYLLVALLFAGLSGYAAVGKGLAPIRYFFIGLAFSLPGYLYVLTRPGAPGQRSPVSGLGKVATTSAPVRCTSCGAMNHPSSSRCSACGTSMTPVIESEVRRVS